MKRTIVIIFLLGFLSYLFYADEGFKLIESGKMKIYFKIEKGNITVKLSAPTAGWVGIGFNPTNKMKDANFIIGYVDANGKIFISDEYGTAVTSHRPDTELGGKDDIINASGIEKDDITEIIFTIPLDSKDKYDRKLEIGKKYDLIVAYGRSDDINSHHKYARKISLQL